MAAPTDAPTDAPTAAPTDGPAAAGAGSTASPTVSRLVGDEGAALRLGLGPPVVRLPVVRERGRGSSAPPLASGAEDDVRRNAAPTGASPGSGEPTVLAPTGVDASPDATAPDPGALAVRAGIARAVASGEVRFVPPPGRSVAQRVDAAAEAGSSSATAEVVAVGPTTSMDPDLGTLADQLYERLEYRLRQDLLAERERRGALPDL